MLKRKQARLSQILLTEQNIELKEKPPEQELTRKDWREFHEKMATILMRFLETGQYPVANKAKLQYDLGKAMKGKAFAGYLYNQIGPVLDQMDTSSGWEPMFEQAVGNWDVLTAVFKRHGITFTSSEGVKC